MQFLIGLNNAQQEAVLATEGPLMIVAGAGAGKTKTITHRIAHLLHKGIRGDSILAITFTNKAAKEMSERVHAIAQGSSSTPFVSTFHALAVTIIREHAPKIGRTRHFSISDESDAMSYVKEAMKQEGIDPKQFEPKKIRHMISKLKSDGITPEGYKDTVAGDFQAIVADVWLAYRDLLAKENALDFDDLICETVKLLDKHDDIRDSYRKRWQYVHVDEYQDTNELQYRLTKLLVGPERHLCVVGDADQNIYSWRGANMKNMLHFEKDYPNAKIVFLEENYRSTSNILAAANAIIEKNIMRVPKTLFTKAGDGELIGLYHGADERDEASFVVGKADELIRGGVKPDDIAVLYRANFQSRIIEEACLHKNVPYQVLGTKFFERKEVKDMLSYVKAAQSRKNLADIRRIINEPTRGIGKVTMLKLFAGEELSGAVAKKIELFFALLDRIEAHLQDKPSELLLMIAKESGMQDALRNGDESDHERLENIYELIEVAKRYDDKPVEEALEQLLTDAALASDQDTLDGEKHGMRLMTVHASKGLEFRYVFIVGLEQGLFPHERLTNEKIDNEEERRLFYVAITRAREKLFLTFAEIRTVFGSRNFTAPSEFLSDIPPELVEEERGNHERAGKIVYLDF